MFQSKSGFITQPSINKECHHLGVCQLQTIKLTNCQLSNLWFRNEWQVMICSIYDRRLFGIIHKCLCRFMSIVRVYAGVMKPQEQVLSQILSSSPHGLGIICLTYRLACLYCFPPLEHCNLSTAFLHVGHSYSQIPCCFSNHTCLKPALIT